ncbi:MAG TPA: AI-2E family transporter YdiK [Myxococcota bacterium]|nr:AI-2E family transporter YdiK [Myxococcota bacterium]
MQANRSQDLARTTFQLLALGALIATSFWIVRPFLVALVWATMIVVATWPLLLHAQAWLGGRRSLAVAVMTIALLLILLVPLYFGVETIVVNGKQVADWSKSLATLTLPQPPAWIETLPVVGAKLAGRWRQLTAGGPDELSTRLSPYVRTIVLWFVGQVGSIGLLVVQFLLTVIIAAILYANGETVARGTDRFARRLAGPQGENGVHLAAQAIRGVALGVVVTAILQSSLAGIGLAIAGVPFATILTVLMFILAVAQIGPAPVLIGAVIWVYSRSGAVWGTGFLVWAIFCGTFDSFLRPVLIKRGADLPLLLIFAGVLGGLIAFGVIGLFIGPAVLAVAYTLLVDWVSEGDASAERGPPPSANADVKE